MPSTGTAAGRAASTARPAAATNTPPAGGSSRRGTSAYAPDSAAARAGLAEPPAAPASSTKPASSKPASTKPAASTSTEKPTEKPAQDPLTDPAPASSSSLPTMPAVSVPSIPGNGAGFLLGLVGYALLVNFMRGGLPQVKGWIGAKFLNKPYQGSTVEATAGGQSARAQRIAHAGGAVDPLVKSHLAALSHATAGKP